MKKYSLLPLLAFLLVSMSSCQAIADIFGAGMKVGAFIVIAIIIVVVIVLFKVLGGRK